jgi:hypothetical protein
MVGSSSCSVKLKELHKNFSYSKLNNEQLTFHVDNDFKIGRLDRMV